MTFSSFHFHCKRHGRMMFLLLGRSRKLLLQPVYVLYKYKKVFLVIISSKLTSGNLVITVCTYLFLIVVRIPVGTFGLVENAGIFFAGRTMPMGDTLQPICYNLLTKRACLITLIKPLSSSNSNFLRVFLSLCTRLTSDIRSTAYRH
jgi:hypothetical protein